MDLGPRRFLLSPRDLAAYDLLPEILAVGVDALKIEGRLKSAEYVAAVTQHYRTALMRRLPASLSDSSRRGSPSWRSPFPAASPTAGWTAAIPGR